MRITRNGIGIELRSIPGITDRYQAGSDGRIYSFHEVNTNAKKEIPFAIARSIGGVGYWVCRLFLNGKGVTKSVHVLVCSAFHGSKPFPDAQVRHLDGDGTNPAPNNLCWGSQKENEEDKNRHDRVARGERHGAARLKKEDVCRIREDADAGHRACDLARRYGVNESSIRGIIKRTRWAHVA